MEDRTDADLDILVVTTTVGSAEDAQRLAQGLVGRRLAACVQVDAGVGATYRWQGKVCEEVEHRLVIKTVPMCLSRIEMFFAEHHPYDVPQCVTQPARASVAYAAWVREACA